MSLAESNGRFYISVERCVDLPNRDGFGGGHSDPYCKIVVDGHTEAKTDIKNNTGNPIWDTVFNIPAKASCETLAFEVYDDDDVGRDDSLGHITFTMEQIVEAKIIQGWFDLQTKKKKHEGGRINLTIQYIHDEIAISNGFPVREGCNVRLYQSAHCDEQDCAPPIYQADGDSEPYHPHSTFEDMYSSMLNAKAFIYITGWSVNVNTSLLRKKPMWREGDKGKYPGRMTVGELLTMKANEGVKVLIHVWNEATSMHTRLFLYDGIMGTHDEETETYFKDTKVLCQLSYRLGSQVSSRFIFSHHQKTITCDEESPKHEGKRRIIAYVGGLDITDGRWDTPSKSLFRSLKSEHSGDFYQTWPTIKSDYGPRQPWQDIHTKLEGPIARDIMDNFVQRWRKQAEEKHHNKLIDIEFDERFISVSEDVNTDPTNWSVQMFRSIDQFSAVMQGVESSIHEAYLDVIKKAEKFIYIENQYFLGSSQYWLDPQSGCEQLIPYTIAKRIVDAIKKGEDFKVYIVIPMYPEGVPKDSAIQEILHWEHKTQAMMYKMVADAIEEASIDAHPKDYLNFYCLGNRETMDGSQGGPIDNEDTLDKAQVTLTQSRRFQVYVHSKMMIVDDKYIIVGSANINQRSMDGARDTEIAVGCYQPMWKDSSAPRGDVHKFRMSLWSEHLAESGAVYVDPTTKECVDKMNNHADANWKLFAGDEVVEMSGHLMRYPIDVENNGVIKPNPEFIPDTDTSVAGESNGALPNVLTM